MPFSPGAPSFCTIGSGSRDVHFVQYSILISACKCDNISMSRGDEPNLDHCFKPTDFSKKVLKNSKFLLTNSQIYDTMCIQGKGNQTKVKKKDLKNRKKFLTNSTKCGIIKTPRGQEPLVIEKMGGDRHQVLRGQKGNYYDYQ